MKKFTYLASGAVLSLIAVSIAYFGFAGNIFESEKKSLISFSPSITEVENEAFGELSSEENTTPIGTLDQAISSYMPENEIRSNDEEQENAIVSDEEPVRDQSGGGGPVQGGLGGGGNAKISATPLIYPYNPVTYKYDYIGDEFNLDQENIKVLKRVKNKDKAPEIFKILANFELGGLNLNQFKNTYLQQLTFAEDRDFGYTVYANFEEENISISENWAKWPQCYDENCWNKLKQLTVKDIPSDEKLIQMATDFLNDYGIDTSDFGKPVVNNYWEQDYRIAQSEGYEYYVPDSINVTFPQIINDQIVYQDNGSYSGLDVNVNIRHNRVSGFWNLYSQDYESSSYEAETDKERIMDILAKGGWQPYIYYEEEYQNPKVVDIKVDTPIKGYLKYWDFKNGISQELLVPALIFPIVEKPEDEYFYKNALIIPLAKELLDSQNELPPLMPLIDEAAETEVDQPNEE